MTVDLDEVKDVVVTTLGVQDRADGLTSATSLMHYLPELDSMGALEVVGALEDRFGITVEHGDLTADVFDSLRSLTTLVESKLR
jgi:acyl carrier protein